MNSIEKWVYDIVKGNPKLKKFIRNAYQSLFDILPDKKDFSINPIETKEGYFFGFHDVSPFSNDEKYILSNKLEIPLRMPEQGDALTVGYWNQDFSEFTAVRQTFAWNYHKGCRLQWRGNNTKEFIFNNTVKDHLGANICSLDQSEIVEIDYPIDTVSPDGRYAASFSYERLNRYMPGYGYLLSDSAFFEEPNSEHTGLFLIDLENNERKLILSLRQLAAIRPEPTMKNANHYVTHTEFSPDGKKIAFLHRWTFDDPAKRWTRLITCDLDGSNIYVSPTSGMVSHYVWDKDYGILAYCQIEGKDGHYLFSDFTMQTYRRVAKELNSDGHQSFVPSKKMFITYPDRRRRAKLFLVEIETDRVYEIANIKSPKEFQPPTVEKHWTCDLHPRVSPSGKYVCFDSVYTGKRALSIMSLNR